MSSVTVKRLANGRARSKTIRINLSPGLANNARLSIGRDACHSPGDDGLIRIEHAITEDFPDGSPTLPLGDDESLWAIVVRLPGGRTQWRRIHLHQNTVLPSGVADEVVNQFQTPYAERSLK
jgi:hypothetical protein